MFDIKKIDDELYKSIYLKNRIGNYKELWNSIKNNKEILREAVKITRDKFDTSDIVKGLAICDAMLIDYKNVDDVAYNSLIHSIYTNTFIARIVIDGAQNGGYSFLLMSLWNHNLKLSEEQKKFAVDEAMNKIGTTRFKEKEEKFIKELENAGISDEKTTLINIDGCINPIGQKAGELYMNYMFSMLSDTQAHGVGEFDIRYYILKNPNWSLEEKQQLIMDFWYDDETYNEYLERWEWGIINDPVNFKGNHHSLLEKTDLYEYTYEFLLKFYQNKEITDRIWNEINFCKQMRKLRPRKWELESLYKIKVLDTL